jgi:ABC-type branched-subunit amino acid transport system ATPase component
MRTTVRGEWTRSPRGDFEVALLKVEEAKIQFGGVHALRGVNLEVEPGTVTGLIGPNGAGKTTLFNAICGLHDLHGGEIFFDGIAIDGLPPHLRARLGIARTFQRLEVFGSLSVRENVLASAQIRRRWSGDRSDAAAAADRVLALVGLSELGDRPANALPTGQARLLELARSLASSPRLLLLDEPSSGLSDSESDDLGDLLVQLAEAGMAILLVEHDMGLVMRVCSRINVLDFGSVLTVGSPAEIRADEQVRSAYLGTADDEEASTESTGRVFTAPVAPVVMKSPDLPLAPPAIELREARAAYGQIEVLHGIDLAVSTGQVLALLGPNGAGKSTTLRVCSGHMAPTSGCFHVMGHHVNGVKPDALARAGLCALPEGRGIFPNLTVAENIRLMTYGGASRTAVEEIAFSRFPRLSERRRQVAGTLSGGEQQMLAMARTLSLEPAVLLLDEISMGLAPLIVAELYDVVAQIAAEGVAVILAEQFASAALSVCTHVAVMVQGRIISSGTPNDLPPDLSEAYLGGAAA